MLLIPLDIKHGSPSGAFSCVFSNNLALLGGNALIKGEASANGGEVAFTQGKIAFVSSLNNSSKINQSISLSKMAKPLVQSTESVNAKPESIDDSTGLILGGCGSARSSRYTLQYSAKQILKDVFQPNGKPFRVVGCLSARVSKTTDVLILKGKNSDVCHFANLQRCGSVWSCPVCAAAITQKRALEIIQAQEAHKKAGFVTLMITFTHSHKIHTKLDETMDKLPKALRYMRNSRKYKKLVESNNYIGLIRALESTYSDANGFHVHTHELFFFKQNTIDLKAFKDGLDECWRDACIKVGLGVPSKKRGVDVRESFSASDYLAKFGYEQKWGAGAELTKSHLKKGHNKSLAMFDFLRIVQDPTTTLSNKKKYSNLFIEFVSSFFGKRQLYWSNGLKDYFKIEHIEDDDILAQKKDDADIVAVITAKNWHYINKLPFDARSSLLRYAELGGSEAVFSYLAFLKTTYACPS